MQNCCCNSRAKVWSVGVNLLTGENEECFFRGCPISMDNKTVITEKVKEEQILGFLLAISGTEHLSYLVAGWCNDCPCFQDFAWISACIPSLLFSCFLLHCLNTFVFAFRRESFRILFGHLPLRLMFFLARLPLLSQPQLYSFTEACTKAPASPGSPHYCLCLN